MQRYPLGRFSVSRIGLGAMQLPGPDVFGPPRDRDEALAAMIQARDEGLIDGIGLSNVTRQLLLHALEHTPIACVQNPLNLADRGSMPVLEECSARGIAFVPFFPLGSGFAQANPVLGNTQLLSVAGRLGVTPAQVALAWLLDLEPCVLLIPGTSSRAHLEENLAAADVMLDEDARRRLAEA